MYRTAQRVFAIGCENENTFIEWSNWKALFIYSNSKTSKITSDCWTLYGVQRNFSPREVFSKLFFVPYLLGLRLKFRQFIFAKEYFRGTQGRREYFNEACELLGQVVEENAAPSCFSAASILINSFSIIF